MKTIIPFLFILTIPFVASAQTQEQKIQEYEMQRLAAEKLAYNQLLDSAIQLSQSGEYLQADTQFRQLLRSAKSVPSDLVYYFGENSFHLNNFKQSVDWLNKYIQLKGTTGQYSAQAVERLKSAEEELMKERLVESRQAGQVLSQDYDIDCGPTGKVTCPVCKGSTVIIKKGYVSDTYKTCPYCNKLGYLQCEDYNLLLKGQLEPSTTNP
ncbi:MAG: hypothetical protein ABJH04_00395 [Cyclobacteriaceae bacterium]